MVGGWRKLSSVWGSLIRFFIFLLGRGGVGAVAGGRRGALCPL